MLKRMLTVALVVAGCQGPEAFRGTIPGTGASSGGSGTTGVAGTGVLAIMVPGTAGDGSPATGVAGTAGPAGMGALAGAAGASALGAAGTGLGAAGSNATGAAGDTSAGAGTAGMTGGAGATAGAGATVVDAGVGGGGGGSGSGARDAGPEAPASVPYPSTNWKPTASITAAGNADLPPNAFDGKIATRWTTGRNQMGGEWFMVDLGQVESVSRVVLDDTTNPQDFPVAYVLEVSTNGTTFATVKTGKGATITDIQFMTTNARYVRIRQTGMTPAGGSWWSIDELRIYS